MSKSVALAKAVVSKLGDVGKAALKPALIVAGALSAAVTLVTLLETYDGFLSEAIRTPEAWLLIAINATVTVVLVLVLTAAFQPQRAVVYAAIVALSFQALIATDLEIQPLAGADIVGASSKVNVGALYNPVERALASGIEDPVEEAKRQEIATLRE